MKRVLACVGIGAAALLFAAPIASADPDADATLANRHDWSGEFMSQNNLRLSSRIVISPYGTSRPIMCSGGDGHYSLFPYDCTQNDDNGVPHQLDRVIALGGGGVWLYR
ncbi:hypothetical protein F3087_08500 [Nocardia colli]|uniref:Uncharacterized protein n=1 Tax=Nocardia colli TaxID=2545717 RepID=A0A5N0ENK7_9NOCA|nr:hypothetical protein [Nocardia colli]KAA8889021.1 hypothetical protein F3087_08500 [Nocardia colli]